MPVRPDTPLALAAAALTQAVRGEERAAAEASRRAQEAADLDRRTAVARDGAEMPLDDPFVLAEVWDAAICRQAYGRL